jgi:transposase InsO family protein
LKNYDNEIKHFIDWLTPYIDQEDGECIGWSWYEEDDKPTLLFKGKVNGNH